MSNVDTEAPIAPAAADLQDERLHHAQGLRGILSALTHRVRDGDLGVLPVVAGLIIIALVFNSLNSIFLSSANLSNLLLESVPVGVIALGIVCVLLLAEIDLSVGSVSGLSAALLSVLWVNKGLPVALAIAIALLTGAAIGLIYSVLFNRLSVPSFVITLAGLLGFVGVQLWLLGEKGAVNLPFDAWVVKYRGVGWMFVFFVALVLIMHYVLTRTAFGRSMFAVGGNPEAARRAGINVKRIYAAVFVMCSTLAALGGILAAARLAAANQQSGGADVNLNAIAAAVIGGTSLFGGRAPPSPPCWAYSSSSPSPTA